MTSKKELSDEELEKEIDNAFKQDEAKRDKCGTPLAPNREVGIQRSDVKLKKKK